VRVDINIPAWVVQVAGLLSLLAAVLRAFKGGAA